MSLRNPITAWTVATIVGLTGLQLSTVRGDDSKPADAPAPKAEPSAAEIGQWIKDLDSDTYAARQAAAQMLYDTGKAAIGPLTEAATGKSLEATMQSVNVLRRLAQSTTNKDAADAARKALESLSQGQTAAAGPAKEALATPPEAPRFAPNAVPGIGGNIQIIPGGRIQILPGGNLQLGGNGFNGFNAIRVTANGNGNRTIDANENGKKTHIEQDNNGIEIKVTEKVNGQDKTDTYKAKDADELKKKYPEAAKIYEKYNQNGGFGNIQIQAQAIPIQGGIMPALPLIPAVPAAPQAGGTEAQKQAAHEISEARKSISEATDGLKNAGANPDALKKALDQLQEAGKKLEEAQGKLGDAGNG
jgi:hypothetical protein